MSRYNEYAVEKVARAMNDRETSYLGINTWDGLSETAQWEYRQLAEAALAAIDSLYESEAEEPVVYAGIEGGL